MVNNGPVVGERELESGDLIQIGPYELGFTFDLSQPFGSADPTAEINESDTAFAFEVINENPQAHPEIIHRTRISRYRTPQPDSVSVRDRAHKELASLYQLTLDMGAARPRRSWRKSSSPGSTAGSISISVPCSFYRRRPSRTPRRRS